MRRARAPTNSPHRAAPPLQPGAPAHAKVPVAPIQHPAMARAQAQAPAPPAANSLSLLLRLARQAADIPEPLLTATLTALPDHEADDACHRLPPSATRNAEVAAVLVARSAAGLPQASINNIAAAIAAANPTAANAPRARSILAPYLAATQRLTLAGSPFASVLLANPLPTESPLHSTFEDAFFLLSQETVLLSVLEGTTAVPGPAHHLARFGLRLAIVELLAPLAAQALDAARPVGSTNRTPVAVSRQALFHGWCLRLDDYS